MFWPFEIQKIIYIYILSGKTTLQTNKSKSQTKCSIVDGKGYSNTTQPQSLE